MKNASTRGHRQRGSVIIVTLWTITLLTILVTAMAGQVRLSARAAAFHQDELDTWAAVLAAVNQAEMELVLEQMPEDILETDATEEERRNPFYRFNGQELQLAYPQAEGITVRIYDNGGKINLRELSRPRMRGMLEKRLGSNASRQIDELMDAWGDWLDLNDDVSANGAEVEYYEALDNPYQPRNGRLETVEELLQIKGFAEVFAGVDLDSAFTLYGERDLINLNLATVEAMQLIPGLNDELIEEIVRYREEKDFSGNGDVAQLVPAENMALLRPWLNTVLTTNFYTIMVYKTPPAEPEQDDADDVLQARSDDSLRAFAEIVEVSSFTDPPKVLKITPYQKVPTRLIVSSGAEADR